MSQNHSQQDTIRVVTSFFVPEAAALLPQPVADALRSHASNPLVREVHILTESDTAFLSRLVSQAISSNKFSVVRCEKRPPFSVLFAHAAGLFEQDPAPVAIMNADVSFAAAEDVRRANAALRSAAHKFGKAILALTRHDKVNGEWRLTLRQSDGLPNTLSADCWILSSPVDLPEADFYCLGHMNCDLMLAYDLVSAGHQIFNPCLDVVVCHHEGGEKSLEFYESANAKTDNMELLWVHAGSRCNEPFNTFGAAWLYSSWMTEGYLPAPRASLRKKIYATLPDHVDDELLQDTMNLEVFARQHDCDLILLTARDMHASFQVLQPVLAGSRHAYLQPLSTTGNAFLEEVLTNGLDGCSNFALSGNPYFLSAELFRVVDAVILDLSARLPAQSVGLPRTKGDVASWLAKRYGRSEAGSGRTQRQASCTLITTLFKSQTFIRKFLSNCAAIHAYDEKVDHLFFVSSPTDTEAQNLLSHLREHPNSLIVHHRKDPGLYACWNQGLELACTWYVSNANADDLRDPWQIWKLIDQLETRPEIAVAASALVPFDDHHRVNLDSLDKSQPWYADQAGEFSYEHLARVSDGEGHVKHLDPHNLPHCMPVWRRSLHAEHGYFDEVRYGTFADWAFWLHVFRRGGKGYLLPEPLSFYYVNPDSHNRRGEKLAEWHHRIEQEHLESFCLRLDGQLVVSPTGQRPQWQNAEHSGNGTIPKLDLHGRDLAYGTHRNSFNTIIEHLEPLQRGGDGVLFLPFIERYFVWGGEDGEAKSANPTPLKKDWIGILHAPFDAPPWFEPKISPENIFRTPLWEQSFPRCRGLITLSKDLEDDLRLHYPDLPTHSLLHPTKLEAKRFDMEAYLARPRVVQAGDWLRKLQAIYQLHAPNHEKVMLFKHWTRSYMQNEINAIGDHRNETVEEREFVSNDEYDDLLSTSVVLCLLYSTAANNLVIECLVRNTPILVNPLPSVVEYLGEDYPLYATTLEAAEQHLADLPRISQTVDYLRERRALIDLSYEGFQAQIALSDFYKHL